MIQAFAPDRADEALREGVLPRALGRRQDFIVPYALHALPEHVTVDRVAIAEKIGRRGVFREGVHDLLGGPVGGWVFGHVEVDDAAAMVGEHATGAGWGAPRRPEPAAGRPSLWRARPKRGDPSCAVGAGAPFVCTRRAAGAGRGSRSRIGGDRRRGTGAAEAGGAGE